MDSLFILIESSNHIAVVVDFEAGTNVFGHKPGLAVDVDHAHGVAIEGKGLHGGAVFGVVHGKICAGS